MAKRKYSGDLARPIPAPAVGLLATEDVYAEAAQTIVAEQYRRLNKLFDLYGVSREDWRALCFVLAEAHVPGMKVAKAKAGRKTKWDWLTRAKLVLAVQATGIENVSEATRHLASVEPWCSLVPPLRRAATLRDEYNRADPRVVQMYRDALANALLRGMPPPDIEH